MYYELEITQVCSPAPGKEAWSRWEKEKSNHLTLEEVRERLIEIYGKVPFKKGNEIYRDLKDGTTEHIGYHYSLWQYYNDRSMPPNAQYWGQDWISVLAVTKTPATEIFLKSIAS